MRAMDPNASKVRTPTRRSSGTEVVAETRAEPLFRPTGSAASRRRTKPAARRSATATDRKLMVPPLAQALQYKNEAIVHKFLESYALSFEEASDLFEETKKWLWLSTCWTVE